MSGAQDTVPTADAPAADGAKLYKMCVGCHGKDGKGQTKLGKKFGVPDFTNKDWQSRHDFNKIKKVIRDGEPNTKMPAFKKRLKNEANLDAVTRYVKAFAGK